MALVNKNAMQIILTDEQVAEYARAKQAEREIYIGKKIRIDWSQTRAGTAIFVSGRMEGPLFDTEQAAKDYLLEDVGVTIDAKGRGARVWTDRDIQREEEILRSMQARRAKP